MGSVTRKTEFVNVGNHLTDWIVRVYDVLKIVVRTAFVTDKPDDVNVAKSGPGKIVKKQFANRIIAIIMVYAT